MGFCNPGCSCCGTCSDRNKLLRIPQNKTSFVLQCPNAATDGSIIVVVSPKTGRTLDIVVPKNIQSGQYLQIDENDTVETIESVNNKNSYTLSHLYAENNNTACACLCFEPLHVGETGQACFQYTDPISARLLHNSDHSGEKIPTEAFDCIRGMGALQVSMGHLFAMFMIDGEGVDFGGENAVLMFFIMSGFF